MFPPLLCLVLLFGLVPCFPLGVFPLPLLTLKKRLYLREQDAGQSLYLMVGYPGSIVVGFLLAWHGITPLEPFLVKQIALEYCSISRYETAPCVFWYLLGGAGVVENDLRKHTIRSAANTEIHSEILFRPHVCVGACGTTDGAAPGVFAAGTRCPAAGRAESGPPVRRRYSG